MNTRGLVELIVLNIGLDLGVITPRLFTMLVIMALVTTMMTSPILMALLRKHPWTEAAHTPPRIRLNHCTPEPSCKTGRLSRFMLSFYRSFASFC